MFSTLAHVRSLEAEIDRLHKLLEQERAEKSMLLDRLLQKHNFAPAQVDAPQEAKLPIQVISPFGTVTDPDAMAAIEQSWLAEEMAYLESEQHMPPEQAEAVARANFKKAYSL